MSSLETGSEKGLLSRVPVRDRGAPHPSTKKVEAQWIRLAVAARPRLDGLRFGNREVELKRLATEFGINPQTLRRSLAALKFIESLEGEKFLKGLSLRGAPVAAIEHLA